MDKRHFHKAIEKFRDLQKKLLRETLPLLEALNIALIDEKGTTNHIKLANNLKFI